MNIQSLDAAQPFDDVIAVVGQLNEAHGGFDAERKLLRAVHAAARRQQQAACVFHGSVRTKQTIVFRVRFTYVA